VKVYVELDNLASVGSDAVHISQPTRSSFELRVVFPDAHHVLQLGPLFAAVASASAKKTDKRIIVTLAKTEEGKSRTWWDLLSKSADTSALPADDDFGLPSASSSATAGLEGLGLGSDLSSMGDFGDIDDGEPDAELDRSSS
jgi:hypothetical protein